jgi:transposase InsO family protein
MWQTEYNCERPHSSLGYRTPNEFADVLKILSYDRLRKSRHVQEFLKRHWELIVAADFFTIEVWTSKGLTRYLVLFFIDLATRKVTIAGIASRANGLWMSQVGRHVTDAVDGVLHGKRYLIHDRGPLFTAEFQSILTSGGIDCDHRI